MNEDNLKVALGRIKMSNSPTKTYDYPIKKPDIAPGVIPHGATSPVLAQDRIVGYDFYSYCGSIYPGGGFPGFQILANLTTRAEYRAFASCLATEMTREWIKFDSKNDDESSANKIAQIEEEFIRLGVRDLISRVVTHDCYYGRAHIFFNLSGQDRAMPMVLSPNTIPLGSLKSLSTVEPMWTSPATYNALDPAAPDFYKPTHWFMLGQQVHSSRMLTIVTREVPDMLKPAFNFAGISLSQLAEPYVDNWLRTRQSVSDLLNNFSITALKTDMSEIFQNGANLQQSLFDRAELFTLTRSNKGLMLLDMDKEELAQVNTPLSGLHELQSQAQEQMCSVSRMPAIVLTGISPSGLNASSDGEIRIFYDWLAAQQEAYYRTPLDIISKVVQLSRFGEIDPDINFHFVPLYQMTPKELAEIRKSDADASVAYINAGVIDPTEERERLANDPESGYHGLDLGKVIEAPESETKNPDFGGAKDEWNESEHPRAENGEFGSGSNNGSSKSKFSKGQKIIDKWGDKFEILDVISGEKEMVKAVEIGTKREVTFPSVNIEKTTKNVKNVSNNISLYHGSNNEDLKEILDSGIFRGLFASPNPESAKSHILNKGSLYKLDIPENKIADNEELGNINKSNRKKVMSELSVHLNNKDKNDLELIFDLASEDQSLFRKDTDVQKQVMSIFKTDDLGEADLSIQGARGQIAKTLGYAAVKMRDEHGISYLVLPGTPLSKTED